MFALGFMAATIAVFYGLGLVSFEYAVVLELAYIAMVFAAVGHSLEKRR